MLQAQEFFSSLTAAGDARTFGVVLSVLQLAIDC